MGDLNPNRAGNVLYLNQTGGNFVVVADGVSNIVVTQLGNLINLQFKNTGSGFNSKTNGESVFETVLDTSDLLVSRMDPGSSSATVPMTARVDGTTYENTTVIVSKTNDNKIQFNVKSPVNGWVFSEGGGAINIEDEQIAYAAAPQVDRDYRL
jgi:hypothetical protein